jgi:hypothetical protein
MIVFKKKKKNNKEFMCGWMQWRINWKFNQKMIDNVKQDVIIYIEEINFDGTISLRIIAVHVWGWLRVEPKLTLKHTKNILVYIFHQQTAEFHSICFDEIVK